MGVIHGVLYAVGGWIGGVPGVGAVDLAVNEALDFHVGPSINSGGVVNGASLRAATDPHGAIAPGTIVSVFGSALADDTLRATIVPLPTKLGGTSVFFNGIPAPLFLVSPVQINAQIPFEVLTGTASVELSHGTLTSTRQPVTVVDVSPGIFVLNDGAGAILHADTFRLVSDRDPTRRGDSIAIYCTGLGQLRDAVVSGHAPPILHRKRLPHRK